MSGGGAVNAYAAAYAAASQSQTQAHQAHFHDPHQMAAYAAYSMGAHALSQTVAPSQPASYAHGPTLGSVGVGVGSGALENITGPTYNLDQATGNVAMTLGVPDNLIGAVLGRQGAVIKEIMSMSGTQIQVSQKGEYLPGTAHRSIRVTGAQAQVQTAYSYITARLASGHSALMATGRSSGY